MEAPDRMHGTSTSRLGMRRMFSRMYTEVGIQHVPFGFFGFSNLIFRKIPHFHTLPKSSSYPSWPSVSKPEPPSSSFRTSAWLSLGSLRRLAALVQNCRICFLYTYMGEPELGVYLQLSGWCFGTWLLFSISYMGYIILPIDELIFFKMVKTTNQYKMILDVISA